MAIIVNGKVRGKQRPRMSKFGVYTPKETVMYERQIRDCYIEQCGKEFDGAVQVDIVAYFKVPKSYSAKQVQLIKDGKLYPTKKPDG